MNIALTLSGGGYRAAAFHTGVLSYLDHAKDTDGKSLLEYVSVLSTVSGGGLSLAYDTCRGSPMGRVPMTFSRAFTVS